MNLKHLSDQELLQNTKHLVQQERELTTRVLHHLREIESRRLFCDLKCTSLFDYAMKELKYSEKEACLRIAAMRVMRDLPEIEDKIAQGSLSLTNLNLAQNLFNKEKQAGRKLDMEEKASFLKQLENKSTRQAIQIAVSVCPEFKPTSRFDFNSIEDYALRDKLLKVKGRFAHIDPHMDLTALLHKLCDDVLEKPMREPTRKARAASAVNHACESKIEKGHCAHGLIREKVSGAHGSTRGSNSSQSPTHGSNGPQELPPAREVTERTPSHPPQMKANIQISATVSSSAKSKAQISREVWRRDRAQCSHCGSTYALETDHRHPRAFGGRDTFENLRLLCRSCNQRAAIKALGPSHMGKFLKSPRRIYGSAHQLPNSLYGNPLRARS